MMQSGKHRPRISKGQKSIIRTRSLGLHDFQLAMVTELFILACTWIYRW